MMFEQFFAPIFERIRGLVSPGGFPLPSFLTQFSEDALAAVRHAQQETRRLGHNYIGTEQILIGLLTEERAIAGEFLSAAGVNLENARIEEEKIVGRGRGNTPEDIPLTPRAKTLMELARTESVARSQDYINSQHLLLALLRDRDSVATRILNNLGADIRSLEQHLQEASS